MKAHVLCIDNNGSHSLGHQKSLEDAGFVVLNACNETQAVNLLKSHPVHVVCVDSAFVDSGGSSVGSNLKSVQPDVPIVLIRGKGTVPADFQEHVDVVIDGPDFDAKARWLIEGIHDVHRSFFLQWLNAWMHHASEPADDATLHVR